jgi:hypothetical protein
MVLAKATADTGWSAAQTAVLIVAGIAIIGGVITTLVTYLLSQRAARRSQRAATFAEAIAAVEDYAEMPYRIRRRRPTTEARYDLTDEVSKIQARLAYHQALLQIEVPEVAEPFGALVRATKIQAGGQMKAAWQQPAFTDDTQMNLGVRYPRDSIDAARDTCIRAMRNALRVRRNSAPPLPTANSDQPSIPGSSAPQTPTS